MISGVYVNFPYSLVYVRSVIWYVSRYFSLISLTYRLMSDVIGVKMKFEAL